MLEIWGNGPLGLSR